MKKRSIVGFVIGCVVSLTACQTSKLSSKKLGKLLSESSTFSQNHTGFVLYDLSEQKEVFNYQGNRYFQPASNTKILTYYVSQRIWRFVTCFKIRYQCRFFDYEVILTF
jgi:D-alanyl-D-alanine carboxypeptidase/D-alanyl-D-alanine-endopeptidase (penicillin-binding protein 4)